jgi:hypothetical protein
MFTTATGAQLIYDRPDAEHPALVAAGTELHRELVATIGKFSEAPEQTTKVTKQ